MWNCVKLNVSVKVKKVNKMKRLLSILALITSSSLTSGEYIAGEYYFCGEDSGYRGLFGFQQRNGTISNPNAYDPKQPSREYIYFMYSLYPVPLGYAPIIEESEKEIFLKGTHFPNYSKSKKEEFFSVIINKEDLSMKGTILNYKTETLTFKTKCRDKR